MRLLQRLKEPISAYGSLAQAMVLGLGFRGAWQVRALHG